jgi:hypothetical protein
MKELELDDIGVQTMQRSLFLLILVLWHPGSIAAVYKCERDGGKIEYQSTPCAEKGREIAIKAAEPPSPARGATSSSGGMECASKELRIAFADQSLKSVLAVVADFSGHRLVADPNITGSGAFKYDCVPWDTVLQDIAYRHKLAIRVEGGTIFARKR